TRASPLRVEILMSRCSCLRRAIGSSLTISSSDISRQWLKALGLVGGCHGFRNGNASTPIKPTLPPLYTSPIFRRTSSAPNSSAARYSARLPELEPQNTQIRFIAGILVGFGTRYSLHRRRRAFQVKELAG